MTPRALFLILELVKFIKPFSLRVEAPAIFFIRASLAFPMIPVCAENAILADTFI